MLVQGPLPSSWRVLACLRCDADGDADADYSMRNECTPPLLPCVTIATCARCAVITGVVLEDAVATPSADDNLPVWRRAPNSAAARTSSWMAPTTSVTAL